ncbi:MAG TPA: family 78 glycoside hydrolase catalytic domain [Chitinophagaceae bacterium]
MQKITFIIVSLVLSFCVKAQRVEVTNLTCENMRQAVSVENLNPSLGWQIKSNQRGLLQTAFRILVSDDLQTLNRNMGNVWDSQKIESDASIHVKYNGKPLKSATTYFWKVQVWTNKNANPAWSESSTWQMGLLSKSDWNNAKWIAYEVLPDSLKMVPAEHGRGNSRWQHIRNTLPLLRKGFSVSRPVKSAKIFISGLGHFELSLNGKKVGDHFLDPGWTQYDKEAQYVTFDVTGQLKQENAIGVMLGNGFYFIPRQRYRKLTSAFGFPKMIFRLYIEYNDGTSDNIISDESWKTSSSPITFSSIYGGEDYNATLEQSGWNTSTFNDSSWKNALGVDGPAVLYAQHFPLKVHEIFKPQKTTRISPGIHVYDLGQNASGIPQIIVRGKKGDTVRIVPAELLKEDGTADQRATGSPVFFDYILKGEGVETWQPRFSYYGFRYLQVERAVPAGRSNVLNLPVILQVNGLHTRNAVNKSGTFTSSSKLFNRTYSLIDWAIKSNLASIVTDCPHREKLGWLEQTHLMGNSIRLNYDMSGFFRKTVRDMMAAQTDQGVVPEFAPEYVKMPFMDSIFMDSPEWGSASIILPWYLYQWYGDTQTMKESYGMMKRYMDHLQRKSKNYILSYGLSDWYDLGPNKPGLAQLTPMGITATAIYYYDLQLMSKIATMMNNMQDASAYREHSLNVKDAFNAAFFNKQTMQYGTGSQTANAMAVYLGLVDTQFKNAVVENIIKDIQARNNSLTTGDVGYRFLLKSLDEAGRSDVIYNMNSRTDVPGYGYQLEKGATALTESWQALPSVSNNHLMLGHLMEWFYTGLAGISQHDTSIAFKQIEFRPQPVGNITSATASYVSLYGTIGSEWKKDNRIFVLKVVVPPNTTATVYLPANNDARILESDRIVNGRSDLKIRERKNGTAIIHIGSGTYTFKVEESK